MTFDQIWNKLTAKRPAMLKENAVIEIKVASLKALLRQAYAQGEKAASKAAPKPSKMPFDDIMDEFFRSR